VDGFLTEELKKHNIEIIRGAISRCGTHEGIVYKDLATGKVYDWFKCLVFACEEDYKANRNGVVLDCLKKKNKKIIIEIERLIEKVVHTLLLFDTHLQKIKLVKS